MKYDPLGSSLICISLSFQVLTTMDPEVAMKKVFQDLKPYSKYRVCVKVLQETTLEWSRSLCIDNRTLEASKLFFTLQHFEAQHKHFNMINN